MLAVKTHNFRKYLLSVGINDAQHREIGSAMLKIEHNIIFFALLQKHKSILKNSLQSDP